MRMILGLDRPTAGRVTVNGQHYRRLRAPLTRWRAARREGRAHRPHRPQPPAALAATHELPASRVDEVIELVGLGSVAASGGQVLARYVAAARHRRRAARRPAVLLFDEPVNGLDPEGIRWIRDFMRRLASEGRTVFVSSHLMSEMALTADHLIVIGKGQLIADMTLDEFVQQFGTSFVRVRSPEAGQLAELIAAKVPVAEPRMMVRSLCGACRANVSASSPQPTGSPCTSCRRRVPRSKTPTCA